MEIRNLSFYSNGVPLGIMDRDSAIYVLNMSNQRGGYFSMTADELIVVTEEMIRDQADQSYGGDEGSYLYEERHGKGSWEELSDEEKEDISSQLVGDISESDLENMVGDFRIGEEDYYLQDVGGGQMMLDRLDTPIVNSMVISLFEQAWEELHLVKLSEMTEDQKLLMEQVMFEYSRLENKKERLLERCIKKLRF